MRLTLVFWLTIGLALNLSGEKNKPPPEAGEDGILIVGNGAEPRGIDPQRITGVLESNIVRALFEGLCLDHPSQNGTVLPGAAERWETNDDFTVWTFHLRPDGVWSDGRPLTTKDFLHAYQRILTPKFDAGYAVMLYFIKGAEEFHKGQSNRFEDVGVRALDDFTLRITLRESIPYLPEIAKHFAWFPVPHHIVSKWNDGKIGNPDTRWTRPKNIVGNGPFILEAWRPKEKLEVAKNPRYWDATTVKLKGIRFLPIADSRAEAQQFFDGKLHLTFTLPSGYLQSARQSHPTETRSDLYFGTRFIRCNVTKGPLKDARVRRALALALDRKSFLRKSTGGHQQPAYGMVPPFGAYQTTRAVKYDPKEARKLFAAAGFADPEQFPRLKLLTKDRDSSLRMARTYQVMWEAALGIKVVIEQKEWPEYLTAMNRMDYDLVDAGWIGDYLDPTTFLGMWIKDGPNNRTGWSNKEYEDLLKRSSRIRDRGERYKVLQGCEEVLMSELPAIPIFWYATNYLLDDRVRGWSPLLMGNHPYKFLSLDHVSP